MASLSHIWSNGRISTDTKLRLYNSLVLSVLLYGAEAWTLTEERHMDTFDQKCLRRILGYRWYDFVSNSTVRQRTGQPPVSYKIRQARLRLFGHVARADPPLEAASLLKAATPAGWEKARLARFRAINSGGDTKLGDVRAEEALSSRGHGASGPGYGHAECGLDCGNAVARIARCWNRPEQ
ncbi:hypothetical protein Bbelb_024920 [Branchiostoma belcheri]|nr:hypothetical protein Bbelb_024920 [Branchiostoma belcheri]